LRQVSRLVNARLLEVELAAFELELDAFFVGGDSVSAIELKLKKQNHAKNC
jgi:hypothetical protein